MRRSTVEYCHLYMTQRHSHCNLEHSEAYMCHTCSMLEHLTPHYEWGGSLKAPIHLEEPVTAYVCGGRR